MSDKHPNGCLINTRTGVGQAPERVSDKHPDGCQVSTRTGVRQAPERVSGNNLTINRL
ncbi:hypothetical protein [Thermophagus xiamenensis]|uniref:hypothetical protein n=1 Tax=Thermophagus xiamenensis TaxID=385682 RepID=UPI001587FA3C|nr:hypothetical protein [Thermophagus xiamenensis]